MTKIRFFKLTSPIFLSFFVSFGAERRHCKHAGEENANTCWSRVTNFLNGKQTRFSADLGKLSKPLKTKEKEANRGRPVTKDVEFLGFYVHFFTVFTVETRVGVESRMLYECK